MSVEEIKKGLASLSEAEQTEVTAFLFHLRHAHDANFQSVISDRLRIVTARTGSLPANSKSS